MSPIYLLSSVFLFLHAVVGSDTPCTSKHGHCQEDSHHCTGGYQSGLCSGHATRRCCLPQHGSCSGKQYACDLLAWHKNGKIHLNNYHPSGRHDQAYSLNNIKDACHGHPAARSGYKCSLCAASAPGGHVCLSPTLLHYLHTLGSKGSIRVNEIAGACHNCNSKHYAGTAVDLHNDARSSEMMHLCTSMGGWALDEGDHIHCQFYH